MPVGERLSWLLVESLISLSSSVSFVVSSVGLFLALTAASLASFFFRALSCFDFKHPAMCSLAVRSRTGRLQCLQITVSRRSSRGLPLGKEAIVSSSSSGLMGDCGSIILWIIPERHHYR